MGCFGRGGLRFGHIVVVGTKKSALRDIVEAINEVWAPLACSGRWDPIMVMCAILAVSRRPIVITRACLRLNLA